MRKQASAGAFYGTLIATSLLGFWFHEFGHYSAGRALGYDMVASLNHATTRSGAYDSARDAFLVTAAGPAVTILQALVAFTLIRWLALGLAYPILFVAFMMRFAALVVSTFNPNDEARMSLQLGWNMWVLPGLVVAGLLALTWAGGRQLEIGWKRNVASYLICSAVFAVVVWLDPKLV